MAANTVDALRQDIASYANDLRSVAGGELAEADQIHVNLLRGLIGIYAQYTWDEKVANDIIELYKKIKGGAHFSRDNFPRIVNAERAAQVSLDKLNDSIADVIGAAHFRYKEYCRDTHDGLTEILRAYQKYRKDSVLKSLYRRIRKGYVFRDGDVPRNNKNDLRKFNRKPYLNFIRLIDRLSLINDSYVDALLQKLSALKLPFDYDQQRELVDYLYIIFMNAEENYYKALESRDEQYKKDLQKKYDQLSADEIAALYDAIVCGKTDKLYAFYISNGFGLPEDFSVEDLCDVLMHGKCKNPRLFHQYKTAGEGYLLNARQSCGKLIYDLKQIKSATDSYKQKINLQMKGLKKDIHHVAQQLGCASKIGKKKQKHDDDGKPVEDDQYSSKYEIKAEADWKDKISPQKQQDRRVKGFIEDTSVGGSLFVGLGEGMVAVMGFVAAFTLFPVPFAVALTVIGGSGWFCNYFLLKDTTVSVLREFFLKKDDENGKKVRGLFLDDEGKSISTARKTAIYIVGGLSIAAGFIYGALSFLSTSSAFTGLLSFIGSKSAIMGLAFAGAAFPAIGCAIGITCIFFTVIADFIRNERWKNIYKYFKETYYDLPWKELHGKELLKNIGHCAIQALKLIVGLGVVATVTVFSFGVFYKSGLHLLSKIKNFNGMEIVAKVMTWLNVFVVSPFNFRSLNKLIHMPRLGSATYATLSDTEPKQVQLSSTQKAAKHLSTIKQVAALSSVTFNGLGQAFLLSSEVDHVAIKGATFAGAFACSAGPNLVAMEESIKSREVLRQANQKEGEQEHRGLAAQPPQGENVERQSLLGGVQQSDDDGAIPLDDTSCSVDAANSRAVSLILIEKVIEPAAREQHEEVRQPSGGVVLPPAPVQPAGQPDAYKNWRFFRPVANELPPVVEDASRNDQRLVG